MVNHNRRVKITIETFNEAQKIADRYKSSYSFDGYLKNKGILEKTESVSGIAESDDKSYVVLDVEIAV
jgi:hypothetical protein